MKNLAIQLIKILSQITFYRGFYFSELKKSSPAEGIPSGKSHLSSQNILQKEGALSPDTFGTIIPCRFFPEKKIVMHLSHREGLNDYP